MISKERLVLSLKMILAIVLFMTIFIFIPSGISKYQSTTNSDASIDIAFYVIGTSMTTESLVMNEISPSEEPYVYTFSVQNYDDNGRIETRASYFINITTTTNIPFTYEIYKINNNEQEKMTLEETITQDEDMMYFRNLKSISFEFDYKKNQVDLYELHIYYPTEYDSYEFQNIVENINITIESKQVLENDSV